ncbi:MAG TPA: flagellin [Acidobacteriaceae bacterium]|nr:flagellin [Acidobacteriaceae bacterium]
MPLGVLNNISAVYAENNLNQTQSSLQNVLTQLSSGSKINSGADDPAGLSIANGLAANSAALTQSSSNASEGAGFLQVADGALSQVTSLLTSAVTLATEAGGGTLSGSQMAAANQEYQDILTQIGTIGSTTEYNGISVFSSDQTTSALTWGNTGTPWTSSTTASSAAVTAAVVASSSIVKGGTTSGTAPTVTQTYATAADIAWTKASDSSTLTSGPIAAGSQLAGTLAFTPTVSSGTATAISIDLTTITGSTLSDQATALATAMNTAAGNTDSDYTVTVGGTDSNELIIGLGADATTDDITGFTAPSTAGTAAAPNGFTMTVTDGDLVSGTIDLSASGSGTAPSNIVLSDVNTADLQGVVDQDLNNGSTTPDYLVAYSSGTLTVSLTSQAATDNLTGLTGAGDSSSALTAAAANAGTITFASGDTLGGGFSITPTTNGSAGTAIQVNLAGVSTAAPAGGNAGDAVVAAVNKALGDVSKDYTVTYASNQLSIAVNPANTDGLESVAVANGTTSNSGPGPLTQGTVAESNISTLNTDMGSFTLTPTGTGTNTAITVSLTGLSPAGTGSAGLQAGIQAQLDAAAKGDYVVSYDSTSDATAGNLSISVTSAGVAAGVTGFSVAEAAQGAASQETPVTGGVNIYTSDGTTTGSQNYNVTVGTLSDSSVGTSSGSSAMGTSVTASVGGVTGTGGVLAGAGAGTSLSGTNLNSQANAEAALETIDNAINAVAYQRGQVGANINTLTAASNIASSQMTNITAAQNTITATDYASATSNMSKYEILTQTGISALAQANSTQQMVTKLLQ